MPIKSVRGNTDASFLEGYQVTTKSRATSAKQLLKAEVDKLKAFGPLNDHQKDAFNVWCEGHNLFMGGHAGTGKTFVALLLALRMLSKDNTKKSIKIIRSAVPVRDIGFLPGTKNEKEAEFKAPYIPLINKVYGRADAFQILEKSFAIEFLTTSHLRGMTLDDSILLVDEVQNMNKQEVITVMTRVGENVSVIVCGDDEQCDLGHNEVSGYKFLKEVISRMPSFGTVMFGVSDIERSAFVKEFYKAKMDIPF